MKQEEIKDFIINKHGISEEQYNLIIRDFYSTLRYYITNPLETKGGIFITGIGSFGINYRKVMRVIVNLNNKDLKRKLANQHSIEFFEKLIDQLKRYERQNSN